MTRKRKPPRPSLRDRLGRRYGWLGAAVRAHGGLLARGGGACVILAGIGLGLNKLKAHVYALPEYNRPVRVTLLDRPAWLPQAKVDEILAGLPEMRLLDEAVSREVAERLSENPWIFRVNRVEKYSGGEVRVTCDFRRPAAVVQQAGSFYLVDDEGVRLPGTYSAAGEFLVIQGVRSAPPSPGRAWNGNDLRAGLRLAGLIARESFAEQVGAVSVHNFAGRESPAEAHLSLVTRPDGQHAGWGRVLWGSGPGDEIEEPTAEQKLRVLRANYQQCGRIDAGASWIDVSISPGEYHRPAADGTRTNGDRHSA